MEPGHLSEPIVNFATRDFTALPRDLTVAEALRRVREQGVSDRIIYFYVVDEDQRLIGVLPTRRLLTGREDQRVGELMVPRVVAIPDTATVLDACELFVLHRFLAFPVVDGQRRLVGLVNVNLFTDEIFDISEKERMDDVFQTIGFRVAEVQNASVLKAFRYRFPWLLATIASGTVCALLAGAYEATLAQSLVLAFFLTLVLGLGESVSAQSLTVTVQALRGARPGWFARALRKEFSTALLLGGACGLLVGAIVWVWRGEPVAAAVVGGSIVLAMITACLLGLGTPALLHRLRLDPKIAAGPLALALADICTLVFYFNLAAFVLG
jgi:magnesium transporter